MNYYVLGLTFLSINLDFFFILLFLLRRYRLHEVISGYVLGTIILLTLSFTAGKFPAGMAARRPSLSAHLPRAQA